MSALQYWPDDATADYGSHLGYRQRRDRRVSNPTLGVRFRGKIYQTVNWSLGGMLVAGYEGVLTEGDVFEIDQIGLAGRRMWPILITSRVVRTGGTTGMDLAAQFITINAPAFDILEGVLLRRPGFNSAA